MATENQTTVALHTVMGVFRKFVFNEAAYHWGEGWKLHLAGPADKLDRILKFIRDSTGLKFVYKVDNNGGQSGKDATVYCHTLENARKVAQAIADNPVFQAVARSQAGTDAEKDDIEIHAGILGRFAIDGSDSEIASYGCKGYPMLVHLQRNLNFSTRPDGSKDRDDPKKKADACRQSLIYIRKNHKQLFGM